MSRFALVLLSICLSATFAFGADGAWNVSSGNWSASGSWNPAAVPDGVATFSLAGGGISTVDADVLISTVNVTGVAGWTWNGTNKLTVGTAFNYGSSGVSTFSAKLAGAGTLAVSNGTLKLTNTGNSYTGLINVSAGRLEAVDGNLGSGTVTLSGGTLALTQNGVALPAGIVARYTFDAGTVSGTTVMDVSGNGNNATLTGVGTGVAAVTNNALDLTANSTTTTNNAYLAMNNPTTLATLFGAKTATFSIWVKRTTSTNASNNVNGLANFCGTPVATTNSGTLYPNGNTQDQYLTTIFRTDQNARLTFSNASYNGLLANWHMVTYTVDASTGGAGYNIYIDGVAIAAAQATNTFGIGGFYIGRNENDRWFQGTMDQAMLFNKALSAADVMNLYTGGKDMSSGSGFNNAINMTNDAAIEATGGVTVPSLTIAAGKILSLTGTGKVTVTGATTLSGDATLAGIGDASFMSLTMASGGTLNRTGAGNFTAGTIAMNGNNTFNINGNGVGSVTTANMSSGGTLYKTGTNNMTVGTVALNGANVLDVAAGGFLSVGSLTVGTGFTKNGAGKLIVSNANANLTGTVTMGGGIVEVGNATSLGTAAVAVNSGTLANNAGTVANNLTLNGGVIAGQGGDRTFSGSITLGTTTTLSSADFAAPATARTLTLSGVISGAGMGLSIGGNGTVTLSGAAANTYSGLTTVTGGTLLLNKTAVNAIAGNVLVAGGTLKLNVADQIADTATVTLDSGTFDLNNKNESFASFVFTGGTLASTGGTITPSSYTWLSTGVTYSGTANAAYISPATNIGASTWTYNVANGSQVRDLTVNGAITSTGTIVKTGAGTLYLNVNNPAMAGEFRVLAGRVEFGNFAAPFGTASIILGDTNGTADAAIMNRNGAPAIISQPILVQAGSSGTLTIGAGGPGYAYNEFAGLKVTGTITLANNLTIWGDQRDHGANNVEIAAPITGTGNVTVRLDGWANETMVATFSGTNATFANNYVGTTQLLGKHSTAGIATLYLNKLAGVTAIPGNLIVGDDTASSVIPDARVQLSAANQIADTAAVTVKPNGDLNLNGMAETIGNLTVNRGTVSNIAAFGVGSVSMTGGTVSGGGTMTLGGDVTSAASATVATISAKLDLGGATRTFNVADGTANDDMVLSGAISGAGGIIKTGDGSLRLAAANSYTGNVQITAGSVKFDRKDGFANNTNTNTQTITVGDVGGVADAGAYFGNNTDYWGAAVSYVGGIVVNSGAGKRILGYSNTQTLQNSAQVNGPITLNKDVTLYADPGVGSNGADCAVQFMGAITETTMANVTKEGTGIVWLRNAANAYTGKTVIKAGRLVAGVNGALGIPAAGNETIAVGDATTTGYAALYGYNGVNISRPITMDGAAGGISELGNAGDNWNHQATFSGPITFNRNINLYGGNYGLGCTVVISGTFTGTGNITKNGGTVYFQNNNAMGFTGNTTINQGQIRWEYVQTGAATPASASFGSGSITLNGGDFLFKPTAASGSALAKLTNPLIVTGVDGMVRTWTAQNMTAEFSGPIALGGGLTTGDWLENWNYGSSTAVVYSGTITVDQSAAGQRFLYNQKNGNADTTISGNIVDGAGWAVNALRFYGTGTVLVTGSSTYANGTKVFYGNANGMVEVGTTGILGKGNVDIFAGRLRLNAAANLDANAVVSMGARTGITDVLSVKGNFLPAITSGSSGVLSLEATNVDVVTDMSSVGNGGMFLGSITTGSLTSASLGVGSGNTYRLGGAGGTLNVVNGVLVGASSKLVVGQPNIVNGAGIVDLKAANTYGGDTTVYFGSTLIGTAQAGGATSFGTTTAAMNLKGGALKVDGIAANTVTEVGATTFSSGASISANNTSGTNTTTINLASLTRANNGSVAIGVTGLGTANKVTVTGGVARPNPAVNMVAPYMITSDGHFMDYGTNGFAKVTYTKTDFSGGDTDIVNITAAQTLTADVAVYAARIDKNVSGAFTIRVGSGGVMFGNNDWPGGTFSSNLSFADATATPVEAVIGSVANDWSITLSGQITAAAGLTKVGNQGVNLTTTLGNTITGPITINQGTLAIFNDACLGSTSNVLTINGGTFFVSTGDAGITVNRNIVIGELGAKINRNYATTSTLAGTVSGPGMLIRSSDGGIALTATNSYEGGTRIDQGSLTVSGNGTLGSGDVMLSGGTLYIDNVLNISTKVAVASGNVYVRTTGTTGSTFGSLAGVGGNVYLGAHYPTFTQANLTVGTNDASTEFYGNIKDYNTVDMGNGGSSTGMLTKVGLGKLSLYGTNQITRGLFVNGGEVAIERYMKAPVTVAAVAALSGNGIIDGSVSMAGKIKAGSDGVGKLTVGSLAFTANTASMDWTIKGDGGVAGANYGQIASTGNVTGLSNLAINVTLPIPSGALNPDVISGNTYHVITSGNDVSSQSLGAVNVNWPNAPYGWQVNATTTAGGVDLNAYWVALPGDADLNGVIDGGDYDLLIGYFGTPSGADWTMGDFDYNGIIDGGDYDLLIGYFGNTYPGIGGSNVPEPTTMGLLALGVIGLISRRRNRK